MTSINFGSVNVLSGTAVNTTGTATINCSGASASTSYVFCTNIASGPDASGNQRRMASGSNDVNFDLYQNSSHTTEWGNYTNNYLGGGNQKSFSSNSSGNISNKTITVYAVLDGSQQTAVPGSYSESFSGSTSNELQYGSTSGTCPTGSSTYQYSFTVTATVATNCNVSTSTLNFGSSGSFITTAINSTAAISVQCTNTTPYSIGLGNGLNASGNQRRMLAAAGQYVSYNLYTDSGYSHAWSSTTSTTSCTAGANTCILGTGTGSNQNVTVYGQVPAQTAPAVGIFSDTVVVTVTF